MARGRVHGLGPLCETRGLPDTTARQMCGSKQAPMNQMATREYGLSSQPYLELNGLEALQRCTIVYSRPTPRRQIWLPAHAYRVHSLRRSRKGVSRPRASCSKAFHPRDQDQVRKVMPCFEPS
jgi:hypothetical protein